MLCGYLNFLNKAVHPGRMFTRRMYMKYSKIVHFGAVNNYRNRCDELSTEFKLK